MTYQVLARKWRPRSFGDMVGQTHVLTALANALDSERLHHAYLFTGTRGVGKTTLARILAKCLNCEKGVSATPCGECSACIAIDEGRFVDLIEVDAASRARVEETRDLMDNVQYAPSSGRFKVYLIDEVHMFSNHSFNALLKTLEEPPPHVKFLLATTEPKKLPVTILSRCLQFNLKHLTTEQIGEELAKILEKEQVTTDEASVKLIAAAANGSMRDALSLLDQAISYGNGELREAQVREMLGTIDSTQIMGFLDDLINGDADALMQRVDAMAEHNPDYDAVLAELLAKLHDMAVAQAVGEADNIIDAGLIALAERAQREDVQLYYQIGLNGRRDLALAPDPRMGFEMTLIRMLAFRPAELPEPAASPPPARTGKAATGRQSAPAAPAQAEPRAAGEETLQAGAPVRLESGPGDDWQQIIDSMGLTGLMREIAGHCVLKEHDENRMHLVLAPDKEHLLNGSQKEKLQGAVRRYFGDQVRLVVSVEEPEQETPAQRRSREEEERLAAAKETLENDPNVKEMIDTFDATLDKDSVQVRS
ncbi:MAG: DNA polymerase III subunit gamma/tau [Gammaproteobacteria bacterium]